MRGTYAKLKKEWVLRGWTDVPWAIVNMVNGDEWKLKNNGAYAAQACDGKTDFSSIAFLPVHNALLVKLIEEGIAEACEKGDSLDPCQQYRKAKNPRLLGIHWSVTGLCNLNCRHCYMEAPSGRYGELTFEDMVRLIEQFERANVLDVSLTGGEPFLRNDLLEIMELLVRRKIRVSQIYSNGLLVTDEILRRIKELEIKPSFQISFDGCGAHDLMRGTKGIENGVVEAIQRVRAAGFPVVIATSIDRMNADRMFDTYALLKGLDIQSWRIARPQKAGNWRDTTTELSLEEMAELCAPLLRRWLDGGKPFHLKLGEFFKGGTQADDVREEEPEVRHTPRGHACGTCREKHYLLPDGTLLPCPAYTDTNLQNRMPVLLRQELSDVLTESRLRSIVDMKKGDLLARNEECATCELFKDCGMGCRASALIETGDLMTRDPVTCEIWKKGYKHCFRELAG